LFSYFQKLALSVEIYLLHLYHDESKNNNDYKVHIIGQ